VAEGRLNLEEGLEVSELIFHKVIVVEHKL
jgi:hypothetical protein